jgi:glycosyltransferase involved in cell wall biosynthesis
VNELKPGFGIAASFQPGRWQPASNILRPFVRYGSGEASPGQYWHYGPSDLPILLSVIIPTLDADRGGYLLRLLDQIERQDLPGFELIVIKGDRRQGRAINVGAAVARGAYLLTVDDDTALPDPRTFAKLVAAMEANPEIGLAGGNNVIPVDASPLTRSVMRQVPRRSWKPVPTLTDSDLAEHPCLMMRRADFMAVGGENELIPRGLDPYLREEFRKSGKRVVVVPGVMYHHLPPGHLGALLRQFFRNGRQSAFLNRKYPQWAIETPDAHGPFPARVSFRSRILRFPVRLGRALVTGKAIWFLCETAYAFGFIREWFSCGGSKTHSLSEIRVEAEFVRSLKDK